jgi:polyferredoxin
MALSYFVLVLWGLFRRLFIPHVLFGKLMDGTVCPFYRFSASLTSNLFGIFRY